MDRLAVPHADLYDAHVSEMTRLATMLVGADHATAMVVAAAAHVSQERHMADADRAALIRAVVREADSHVARDGVRAAAFAMIEVLPLRRAVEQLTVRHRAVMYLSFGEGLSVGEAGALLGWTRWTVRRRLATVRSQLQRAFDGC